MTSATPPSSRHSTQTRLPGQFKERQAKHLADVAARGELDGRQNIPPLEQDYEGPYELQLRQWYQGEMGALETECTAWLQDIHDQRVKSIQNQLDDIEEDPAFIERQINTAAANRDRELREAEDNHKEKLKLIETEPSWDAAKKSFKASEVRFDTYAQRHGRRQLDIHFRATTERSILAFIGMAEVPINYQVFVSFREAPLMTLIMASALVIAVPLMAHGSGKCLRQFRESRTYLPWFLALLVLILGLSFATATLRSDYLATLSGTGQTPSTTDFVIFFLLSVVLYAVGSLVSFFSHDPSVEFTLEYRSFVTAKEEFEIKLAEKVAKEHQERDRFEVQSRRIQDEFTRVKREWEAKKSTLEDALAKAKADYDAELGFLKGFEKTINSSFKEALQLYRGTNLTYRLNHALPYYWKKDIADLQFYFYGFEELSPNPRR